MSKMQLLRMMKVRIHVLDRNGSVYTSAFSAFATPSTIIQHVARKIRKHDFKARRIVVIIDVEE